VVLTTLAPEVIRVHESRGLQKDTSLWFYQTTEPKLKKRLLASMTHLGVSSLHSLQATINQYPTEVEDRLIVAGRILARMLDPTSLVYRSARSWFGKTKVNEFAWFVSPGVISHSNWSGFNSDFDSFFSLMEQLFGMLRMKGLMIEQFPFEKQMTGLGWNLHPLRELVTFATVYDLSWRGLYLALLQRQKEGKLQQPTWKWTFEMKSVIDRQLHGLTAHDRQSIPRSNEEWKVDVILALGLPGGCRLPDKLKFGTECRTLERSDMRLTALSDGQALYRDWQGKVYDEGHPLKVTSEVASWGTALQIWMTKDNYAELLPLWYSPPARCPWSWYQKWGNNIYREDGTAVHPSKFNPPVQWLEMTG
jgi:hypothetical protein